DRPRPQVRAVARQLDHEGPRPGAAAHGGPTEGPASLADPGEQDVVARVVGDVVTTLDRLVAVALAPDRLSGGAVELRQERVEGAGRGQLVAPAKVDGLPERAADDEVALAVVRDAQ